MPRILPALAAAAVTACATPPPPAAAPEAPPPVIISEPGDSITEAAPEPPAAVAEAAPAPQKPPQTDAGRFRIGVASLDSAEAAAPWVSRLQAAGYRTEVLPVVIEGRTWHRVLLPGYADLEQARAAIPFVEQEFGLAGVWVTSRRRAPAPDAAPAMAASEPPAEAEPSPKP